MLASLKVMFARTVALALGIAEMLNLPCTRVLAPVIALFAAWCGTDRVILVKAVRRIWQVLFK